jgi:Na+/H+ antiporter NhaD/arsenite permease-like protein
VAAALAIFTLTYLAIAAGRVPWLSVDRPAAALLGAVMMVATGVLLPAEAGAAVNGDTLGLLLGMMILAAYLGEAGFFRWASWRVIRASGTPRSLLWGLTLTAGLLSAFLVNDTVCLLMTPLVVRIIDDAELPPLPFLLAIAFGSNAGSVATLTGNPQNMLVGTLSGISWTRFAGALALPALASLLAVAALLHWQFRAELPRRALTNRQLPEPPLDPALLRRALFATGLCVAGFLSGFPLSWTALFAAALLMAVAGRAPREALARVDWPLLLFFAGLFVVVAGVGRSGLAELAWQRFAPWLGTTPERQGGGG